MLKMQDLIFANFNWNANV